MLIKFNRTVKRVLYLSGVSSVTNVDVVTSREGCLDAAFLYAFSVDGINWSTWDELDTFLAKAAEAAEMAAITFFVRILVDIVQMTGEEYSNKTYNELTIEYITISGSNVNLESIEYFNDVNIVSAVNSSAIFNPFRNIENAKLIREQLSQSISDSTGYLAVYFKTEALESSKSIKFKSYDVHNVIDKKELKVVLPNGQEYDGDVSSYQMMQEYENLEIEITKKTFHDAFGPDVLPSAKDAIWIALFNRMYRIVTPKENRNFMNSAVAYRFYLGKWHKDIQVQDENDEIDEFTDYEAFDLETSINARDEVENATGKSDTFEDKVYEFAKEYPNSTSKLNYYDPNLLADRFSAFSNGIEFAKFSYRIKETSASQYLVKYDSLFTENQHTVVVWFSVDDLKTPVKIASLIDVNKDSYVEQFYVSKTGKMMVHVNVQDGRYLTLQGNAIQPKKKYCLAYSKRINSVVAMVYEYDEINKSLIQLQSTVDSSVLYAPFLEFAIMADKRLAVSNIRLAKRSYDAIKLEQFVVETYPDARECEVIDNCDVTAVSEKRSTY